jgi:hypothetical protein
MRLAAVATRYERHRFPPDAVPSDVAKTLTYRPELFGRPFSEALEDVMRGPSAWGVGERELMAAYVSAQNQCPF